jgi:hypothetical protein
MVHQFTKVVVVQVYRWSGWMLTEEISCFT